MFSVVIGAALVLSFLVYLFIGFRLGKSTKSVGDMLPISVGKQASVRNSSEFSASTVATTISLATVVVAFFELAPYFGVWLFWCVLTTSLGIFAVRLIAPSIWKRLASYDNRPSLHEFLGVEYQSDKLAFVGAICTSLGFLGAFAVELTVGSRFLSGLIQGLPQWLVVAVLSAVSFVYTSAGGFRAVVLTDKIQMVAIWLLLISLSAFMVYHISSTGGLAVNLEKIPADVKSFTWRPGLGAFMIGIFVINILSYMADMSIWQRIAASDKPETVLKGLASSVSISAITWTILVALACLTFMVVKPETGENPLITLLAYLGFQMGVGGKIVLFMVVLGLFGAMLSTASTQLIAVSHTIYEDISAKFRKTSLAERLLSKHELNLSRIYLIYAALGAVIVVEILTYYGFSVADMVFAVYGAQLGLFPPIVLGLIAKREQLKRISHFAEWGIIVGFVSGWGIAITEKTAQWVLENFSFSPSAEETLSAVANWNLSYHAPLISLGCSALIVGIGWLLRRKK